MLLYHSVTRECPRKQSGSRGERPELQPTHHMDTVVRQIQPTMLTQNERDVIRVHIDANVNGSSANFSLADLPEHDTLA